jgi:hypothetical protein
MYSSWTRYVPQLAGWASFAHSGPPDAIEYHGPGMHLDLLEVERPRARPWAKERTHPVHCRLRQAVLILARESRSRRAPSPQPSRPNRRRRRQFGGHVLAVARIDPRVRLVHRLPTPC